MEQRKLGGLKVSAMGLGCMSMSQGYGSAERKESERTLHRALDIGYIFWTQRAFTVLVIMKASLGDPKKPRDEFFLASKCGIINKDGKRGVDGTPKNISQTLDDSLKRLNTDYIDLYYLHRRDFNVPIEESVGALADAVKAGKIGHIGLSECSSETIGRAHAEHKICAVQSEYSLWTRDPEYKVIQRCKELGIGFVPFSPLGRAFLSGLVRDMDKLEEGDMRHSMPRFSGSNFVSNLKLVDDLAAIAKDNNCTPAQLALAWVLSKDSDFVPIPGTKHVKFLEENAAAADLIIRPKRLGKSRRNF